MSRRYTVDFCVCNNMIDEYVSRFRYSILL